MRREIDARERVSKKASVIVKTPLVGVTFQIIPHLSLKGVVSFNRQKKLTYFKLQSTYKNIKEKRFNEIV